MDSPFAARISPKSLLFSPNEYSADPYALARREGGVIDQALKALSRFNAPSVPKKSAGVNSLPVVPNGTAARDDDNPGVHECADDGLLHDVERRRVEELDRPEAG